MIRTNRTAVLAETAGPQEPYHGALTKCCELREGKSMGDDAPPVRKQGFGDDGPVRPAPPRPRPFEMFI